MQVFPFFGQACNTRAQSTKAREHVHLPNMVPYCVQEAGGIMTLADVYCRFNRARGMEVCMCTVYIGICLGTLCIIIP